MIRVQIITAMAKLKQPAFKLDQAPGHLLRRAQQRAVELFATEIGRTGPTPQQFALLFAVARHPGISQIGLVREIGVDRSTVAEMVERLSRRGLIVRQRTRQDGRENTLRLTVAGSRLLDRTIPRVVAVQTRIMAVIPARQRKKALQILRLLAGVT
jgi:DNA-binding MarR family transcriptional regulator